jgi:hypothetical protein
VYQVEVIGSEHPVQRGASRAQVAQSGNTSSIVGCAMGTPHRAQRWHDASHAAQTTSNEL